MHKVKPFIDYVINGTCVTNNQLTGEMKRETCLQMLNLYVCTSTKTILKKMQ